jgi:type IX secretion system substrate protein
MKRLIIYFFTIAITFSCANCFAQNDTTGPNQVAHITVFPNPAPGDFITIENDSCSYTHFDRLLIFDSNGFQVRNEQFEMYKGTTKQHIDISKLRQGNYSIRIVDTKNPYFSFAMQLVVD